MAVQIKIPTPLRKLTGGADVVEVDAATAGAALDALRQSIRELKPDRRRFGKSSSVHQRLRLEDIRFQDKLETALTDGDELAISPAIAGGR